MAKLENVNVDRIKALAQEMGMTMKYLAGCIGKHPGYLSCVRNGTDRISEEDLTVIADRLSTTVQYLTNQTDDPKPPPMEDEQRIARLMEVVKNFSTHQMDDLIAFAEIVESEILYGFPDEYVGFTGDRRDLIACIKSFTEKKIPALRKLVRICETCDYLDELIELNEVYIGLPKSGKRQLLGKAYELLDAQATPRTGDELIPPNIDMVATVMDSRIKK